MEKKIKHLEMIQGVINRLAGNSFALKGWAVTLVTGIFVLAGNNVEKSYFLIAYIPIFVFGWLDANYLLKERLYRSLYDKVRDIEENDIDFSLTTTTKEFESPKNCMCQCIFSKTIIGFYAPLLAVCALIIHVTQQSLNTGG